MKKALAIVLLVIMLIQLFASCNNIPDEPVNEETPKAHITLAVSQAGDDSTADGTAEKPFATIGEAVKSAFLLGGDKYSTIDILIGEGTYTLDTPIVIKKIEDYPPIRFLGEGSVTINGQASTGLFEIYCDGITLKNLKLNGSLGNGIVVSADNFSLLDCEIANISGEYALKAVGSNITITGNHIHDCSGSAVFVNSGDMKTLTKSNSKIYNNLIHDYGTRDETTDVGIGAYGVGITVSHNEIQSSPSAAIVFNGAYNVIEYNKISDIAQNGAEIGAISTRGIVQVDNVIRYNHIQNIGDRANPATNNSKSVAIKCEDAASYYEIYGNIIEAVSGNGIKLDSRHATIRNNLLIDCSNWYVWHVTSNYFDHFKWGNNGKLKVPDYIYSPVWKEANPDLASLITDLSQTTFTDPRAWSAPVGITLENNLVYFNRYGRAFSNWGTAPYSVDEAVFRFSGETVELEGPFDHGSKNITEYNSKRNKIVIEDLLAESAGPVDLDIERFNKIGRVMSEWNLDKITANTEE